MSRSVASFPASSTRRLLLALALVLGGHIPRLPLWLTAIVAGLFLWRSWQTFRPLPSLTRSLKLLLALGLLVGVYASYGRINGQNAGVALLIAMLGAKLTELDDRRSHVITILFGFFLLATHFLYSQELIVVPYAALGILALCMCLIDLSYPNGRMSWITLLRRAGNPLLQAVPLMVLMFLLFPRIPGPLWGLPNDAGAARSGLSDRMEPGSVADLALSDEVVFRVEFVQPPPSLKERYWRGPVFWQFDGRSWSEGARVSRLPSPSVERQGTAIQYTLTLEPNRQRWLFALDFPALWPADALLDPAGTLIAHQEIKERRRYTLTSHVEYRLDGTLPAAVRAQALQFPPNSNPRTRAFAQQLRTQFGADDAALVRQAVFTFREQAFAYTLRPPRLGRDWIDEFLFDTRRGFCEHFAGSFTFLMRAAGIPSRVVTGYQGGERSTLDDYYIIRQSDAHAWSEVWLAGRGWVRIDPTAAVAPERVELNLEQALGVIGERLPIFTRRSGSLHELRMGWDWVNAQWNRAVLGYGPELQAEVLARLGLIDWARMVAALTLAICGFLAVTGVILLNPLKPLRARDPVLRAWQRFSGKLRRAGLTPLVGETPAQFAERATQLWPEHGGCIQLVVGTYLTLRYAETPPSTALLQLEKAVGTLRLKRRRPAATDISLE